MAEQRTSSSKSQLDWAYNWVAANRALFGELLATTSNLDSFSDRLRDAGMPVDCVAALLDQQLAVFITEVDRRQREWRHTQA